jgi:hypothetical protein
VISDIADIEKTTQARAIAKIATIAKSVNLKKTSSWPLAFSFVL